ncbi:MAG: SDR family oxidoreductase [Caulobacteraceae bacterium]|nr:SDR family oxidoreductase [Caulobacteraceae bacterium]
MVATRERFRLDGKVAIIAGVGETNSRHIALALADAGADVALVARRTLITEPLAEEIRAMGRRALAIQADFTDSTQVDDMVGRTRRELGRLDVLFNHAGSGTVMKPVIEMTDEEWRGVFAANVDAAFFATRAAARVMIDEGRGGSIINTSSTASRLTPPMVKAYAVAKAALNHFTRCMAEELAPHGIRVNSILLGTFENAGPNLDAISPGFKDWWLRETPLGRFGQAHESAGAALYLASEASSYTTGAILSVTGGIAVGA